MSCYTDNVLGFDYQIEHHVPMKQHSTMRIGGPARYFIKAKSSSQVQSAYQWATAKAIDVSIIGSGSNIVWTDTGFDGLVLKNDIKKFELQEINEDEAIIHLGAGEILDSVVERTVHLGFWGIERLSHIPGTCGGAVFQNSGAYGQEISQVLVNVEVFDLKTCSRTVLHHQACDFRYRSSIFKCEENGRYVILGLTIRVQRQRTACGVDFPLPGLTPIHTLIEAREAVIDIRKSKLPDTAAFANCGSFFVNPVIKQELFSYTSSLLDAPHYKIDAQHVKVPAAWLIEQCGLKGHVNFDLGFATWPNQPLCIFAIGKYPSYYNLMEYAKFVVACVSERFGIILEREPIVIGD